MAIFKPRAPFESISGRCGSVVFRSRLYFGTIGRAKARRGSGTRARLSPPGFAATLARAWGSLTESEREAWTLWANTIEDIFGDPGDRRASGFGAWVRTNAIRAGAGLPLLMTAPSEATPFETSTGLDVQQDLTAQQFVIRTLDGLQSNLSSPQTFRFQASTPQRRSRSAFRDAGRIVGYAPSVDDFFPWTPTPLRLDAIDTLAPGRPCWLTWRVATDSGSVSVSRRCFVDVPDVGNVTAMRARPQFGFSERASGGYLSIDAASSMTITEVGVSTHTLDITPGSGNTLSSVRSWIEDTVGWEVRDFNSSKGSTLASTLQGRFGRWQSLGDNLALLQVPA